MNISQKNKNKEISISICSDRPLGTILITGGKLNCSDIIDFDLQNSMEMLAREGIPYAAERRSPDGSFVSVFRRAFLGDGNFYFELINVLKKQGYTIVEEHTKINQELKDLLNCLPDTPSEDEMREKVENNLDRMNFLEKTYIKKNIEDLFEKAYTYSHRS